MRLHFGSKRGPICVPLGHLPWAGAQRLGTRGHYDHPLIPRSYQTYPSGRDKGPLGTPWEAREGILKGPFGAPWGAPAGLPRQSPDSNPQTHRQYSPRGVKKARSYRAHTARIQFLGGFFFPLIPRSYQYPGFPAFARQ